MTQPKLLVFGANGQVGRELLARAGSIAQGVTCAAVDICDRAAVRDAILSCSPAAIVNAAAYTAVDRAETEPDEALRVNRDGAAVLAAAAASAGVPFIHLSTDYVFDGTKQTPYLEDDPVSPLNVYGLSKAEGERTVRTVCPRHIILRTSWVYSPHGTNFVRTMLRLGALRDELRIVDDQIGCPTAAVDIAEAILNICDAVAQPEFSGWGTYHYRGADVMTWFDLAARIFEIGTQYGVSAPRLIPIDTASYSTAARRPAYSVLAVDKIETSIGLRPRPLAASLHDCLEAMLKETAKE